MRLPNLDVEGAKTGKQSKVGTAQVAWCSIGRARQWPGTPSGSIHTFFL